MFDELCFMSIKSARNVKAYIERDSYAQFINRYGTNTISNIKKREKQTLTMLIMLRSHIYFGRNPIFIFNICFIDR
jgi:hypothetical protein